MTERTIDKFSVWKSRLEVLATVLLILVTVTVGGLALVDRVGPAPPTGLGVTPALASIPMSVEHTPLKGSRDAKVALVLFSDFECPVCKRAAREVLPELQAQYIDTGKVLLVWRHFPLPRHSSAFGAAVATECAGRQGRFWELHDWAFAHQQDLASDRLREAVAGFGLDMPAFDRCIGGEADEKVAGDIALAKQLDVTGTPTWFIGTVELDGTVKLLDRITGLGPADVYGKAIDRIARSR